MTTTKLNPLALAAVQMLETLWGERFKFNHDHTPGWNHHLGTCTPAEISAAIMKLVRYHTHGAPYLADVMREVISAREAADFLKAENELSARVAASKAAKAKELKR